MYDTWFLIPTYHNKNIKNAWKFVCIFIGSLNIKLGLALLHNVVLYQDVIRGTKMWVSTNKEEHTILACINLYRNST